MISLAKASTPIIVGGRQSLYFSITDTSFQVVGLEPEFWSSVTGERGDASAAATAGFQRGTREPAINRDYVPWCLYPALRRR
jgi:hypothetical protein